LEAIARVDGSIRQYFPAVKNLAFMDLPDWRSAQKHMIPLE
jgi:hypothetical protein